ncbi:hypothetical protein ACE4Z5_25380, partial [Salmonella enterica]|uniref:hypothetical protein n=1 Tax=Salmonella enterica TaxID=28901 RepID=UPI003D2D317C
LARGDRSHRAFSPVARGPQFASRKIKGMALLLGLAVEAPDRHRRRGGRHDQQQKAEGEYLKPSQEARAGGNALLTGMEGGFGGEISHQRLQ